MAAAANTQVSLVACINPSDAPAANAQPSDPLRTYRHAHPSVANVKNTSSISWM